MNRIIISGSVLSALVFSSGLNAEWVLQDDMENGLDKWVFSDRISLDGQDVDPLDGSWVIADRPYDNQGGKALAISEGIRAWNILNVGLPLGDLPNTEGAIFTFYFEMAQTDLTSDRVFGLTDGTPEEWFIEDPLNPGVLLENLSWGDYTAVHRAGKSGMDTRNAEGTGYTTDDYTNQINETWYRFWMVIDPWFYTWDLYVQGGEFTEQTKVTTAVEGGYLWRNITEDHNRTFWVRLSGNTSSETTTGAPTYIDNVYLDLAGANLGEPPVGPGGGFGDWALWPILDEAGNVDTGAWMGYLNVNFDPYVWSYSLNQWLYIDAGSVTEGGSWAYAFNF